MNRRNFLKRISAATTGLALAPLAVVNPVEDPFISNSFELAYLQMHEEMEMAVFLGSYNAKTPFDTLLMAGIAVEKVGPGHSEWLTVEEIMELDRDILKNY